MTRTRKLRRYISDALRAGDLNKTEADAIRKRIKNNFFRSKAHLKEHIGGLEK